MAPRQEFREDRPDVVDIVIRAVLRQRVAGARPSPCVWKRIEEQVQRLATDPRCLVEIDAIAVVDA